jgi:hypothetical protein
MERALTVTQAKLWPSKSGRDMTLTIQLSIQNADVGQKVVDHLGFNVKPGYAWTPCSGAGNKAVERAGSTTAELTAKLDVDLINENASRVNTVIVECEGYKPLVEINLAPWADMVRHMMETSVQAFQINLNLRRCVPCVDA